MASPFSRTIRSLDNNGFRLSLWQVQIESLRRDVAVQPEAGSRLPLQHGMPGTMEIAVEQASPLQLALRAVGKWLR